PRAHDARWPAHPRSRPPPQPLLQLRPRPHGLDDGLRHRAHRGRPHERAHARAGPRRPDPAWPFELSRPAARRELSRSELSRPAARRELSRSELSRPAARRELSRSELSRQLHLAYAPSPLKPSRGGRVWYAPRAPCPGTEPYLFFRPTHFQGGHSDESWTTDPRGLVCDRTRVDWLREQRRWQSSRQLREEVRGPRWHLQRHSEELQ